MALTTTTSMKGTPISYIGGMSSHRIYLTVEHKSTKPDSTGATGATELTWRVYYELNHKDASIWSNQNYTTKFTINGKAITCNWNLGGTTYYGVCYINLGSGTISIPRNLDNDESYKIKCQITSSYVLTSSSSISNKTNGPIGYFSIPAITLATNVTPPILSFENVSDGKISFCPELDLILNYSGQREGTNNAIKTMTLQYSINDLGWNDYGNIGIDSSSVITKIGENGIIKILQGDEVKFRIATIGATLSKKIYSNTLALRVNRVPVLNSIIPSKNKFARKVDTEISFITKVTDEDSSYTLYYVDNEEKVLVSDNSFTIIPEEIEELSYNFCVYDGYNYSNEITLTFIRNDEIILGDPVFVFESPDEKNQNLTKKLLSASSIVSGGSGKYSYQWKLGTPDSLNVLEFDTDKLENLSLSSLNPGQISYELIVTDELGDSEIKSGSTEKSIPNKPLITEVSIFSPLDKEEEEPSGRFYSEINYEISLITEDNYATIEKYLITPFKEGETTNTLPFIEVPTEEKTFIINGEAENKYGIKVVAIDVFGQESEINSSVSTLQRIYHLNELFIENSSSWNPIVPNPFKPLSSKENLTFNGKLGYYDIFNDTRKEEQNLSIKVIAFYNNTEKTKVLEDKINFNKGTSSISFSVPNDSDLFIKSLNDSFNCVYKIVIKNQFGDSFSLSSVDGIIDYREPSSLIETNTGGWILKNKLEEIKDDTDNGIGTIYYLSYGDEINFSSIIGEENSNINDLNGNGIETVLSSVEAYFGNDLVPGIFNKGIWTNLNRLDTKEGIIFKATLTDSTGLTYEQVISTDNCIFHACRSEYPTIQATSSSENIKEVNFSFDMGHDTNYENYNKYKSTMSETEVGATFSGIIYRGITGYTSTNNGIKFSNPIDNITVSLDSPTTIYCTYDPILTIASGTIYNDIPNLTWIWFGEAPTISPRKNRLGINVKAEGMDEDILLQINMANKSRKCVKLVGIANEEENNIVHELIINLYNGQISGFIISGGTWDKPPTPSNPEIPEPEAPETEEV